jgi:hypothetical protein
MLALLIIGVLSVAMPISAKTNTLEQSTLPIPLGFCIYFSIPIGDSEFVDSFIGESIWLIPQYYVVLVNGDLSAGDTLEGVIFVPTDIVFDINSYDSGFFDPYLFFEGLGANFFAINGAELNIVDSQNCSFQAYDDNAALAQTYMVPNKGFDVYQIFPVDGVSEGILSFTVSIDDISGASAGDVLGSNDAGNIYFTYNGGGTCSVTYPYPDGKTNSQSFVCWK